jgi:hypothetical protein
MFKYTVMLYKQGTGVVAFENVSKDEIEAVKKAMNTAFSMFPDGKFALHGYSKSDGETTVTTERYLGRI